MRETSRGFSGFRVRFVNRVAEQEKQKDGEKDRDEGVKGELPVIDQKVGDIEDEHQNRIEKLGGELAHPFDHEIDVADQFRKGRADVFFAKATMQKVVLEDLPHRNGGVIGEAP